MYPQFTTEVAAQRRQALTAFADRRRLFGRRTRTAATADAVAVDTVSLAHLVHLPVHLDGYLGEHAASVSPWDARVA
jgi:hypothetical protein